MMNYLPQAFWHGLRGHRMAAIPADTGGGVFVFCAECFNNGKNRLPFGYFPFGNLNREDVK